jgi:uncharacterized protein
MVISAFRGMKPLQQLVFSAFVIIVSFLIFLFISLAVAVPVFGLDSVINMPSISDLNNPESLRILKYFQVVQSVGLFIIPPFILGWLFHGNTSEYLGLDNRITLASVVMVTVLIIASQPFINFVGEWNMRMHFPERFSGVESWMKNAEENAALLTEAFLDVETTGGLLFNLFMIALLPAVGEELLFRGVVQKILTNWTKNHHWGIWLAAILFSALHIQFYGFVPRMLLGVIFGYLLVWSGSIWLPVVAHFINNASAVTAMYFIEKDMLNPSLENIGSTRESYYLAGISLVVMLTTMWMIKRDKYNSRSYYA